MSREAVHSLGTAMAIVTVGLCTAVALYPVAAAVHRRRRRAARRRLRLLLLPRTATSRTRRRTWTPRPVLRAWGPVLAATVGAALLVGGTAGWAAGPLAGCVAWRLRRGSGRPPAEEQDPVAAAQIPLCADLMAACLAAGAGPREAAEAVGRSLGAPVGDALIRVGAELRLGGDPAQCWERFGELTPARAMARCLSRASAGGVAPVEEMARLAADCRAAQGRAALARARRAGVLATAPLGLCFLPAFLLVGVAPVVMGLAGAILAGSST